MPFFGVEDVLFLLASTSPLLWIKRHELIELGVYGAVKAVTRNASYASQCASRAVERYRHTPILLLREIDINSNNSISSGSKDKLTSSTSGSDLCEETMPQRSVCSSTELSNKLMETPSLIRTGLAGSFRTAPTRLPNVPHRFFNSKSNIPHVSYLAYCHELEVSKRIRQYSRVEVQTLFNTMELEGMWEAVIRVSRGIEMAHASMTYLSQLNIETALRTLFAYGPSSELALAYYFTYGEDILPSDDILVALFDACRENARASMDLYVNLRPFRRWWSEVTYACCLSTLSRSHYAETIALYKEYLASHLCQTGTNDFDEFFENESNSSSSSSSSTKNEEEKDISVLSRRQYMFLQEYRQNYRSMWERLSRLRRRCCNQGLTIRHIIHEEPSRKLNYLYHIIVPLVAEHAPHELPVYVADMLRNDREAAPDVFLKCLRCEQGRKLAELYLQQTSRLAESQNNINEYENSVTEYFSSDNKQISGADIIDNTKCKEKELTASETFRNVVDVGVALYKLKPCAMNINTLLEIVLWHCVKHETNSSSSTDNASNKNNNNNNNTCKVISSIMSSPSLRYNAKTKTATSLLSPSAAAVLGLNVANINQLPYARSYENKQSTEHLTNTKVSKSVNEERKRNGVECQSQLLENEHIGKTLLVLLKEVPLREGVDSAILARTLTTFPLHFTEWTTSQLEETSNGEENKHTEAWRYYVPPWPILCAFMQAMLIRRELNVIPRLAEIAMRVNEYAYAARVMSIYLSNQRGALTSSEVNLCIEACVRAHRYESALFWLERARTQNLELTSASCQLAREAIQHSGSWQAALSLAACTLPQQAICATTFSVSSGMLMESPSAIEEQQQQQQQPHQQHKEQLLTTSSQSLSSTKL